MSFDISVTGDVRKLRRDLTGLQYQAVPKVTARSLNRTANSAKTASVKHIAPLMNSRQAAVRRRIETHKANARQLWAVLVARGRSLQLIDFVVGSKKPTQQPGGKRGVVRAKVYGKVRTLHQAFIAPVKRGSAKTTVYLRKTAKRLPLKMLYGPGIKQLFKQKENDRIMQAKVREVFPREFERNMIFALKRLKMPLSRPPTGAPKARHFASDRI